MGCRDSPTTSAPTARICSRLAAWARPVCPPGLLAHVIAHKRPVLITEAASHRAQRRTNIETVSRMLLPVVRDDVVLAVVVCERVAPGGFDPAALETATVAVEAIEPALIAAAAEPPPTP